VRQVWCRSGHPLTQKIKHPPLHRAETLDAANHRNKQLRDQIAELTARLETAYGEIRALRNAQPNN
jgi:hypothetical protein